MFKDETAEIGIASAGGIDNFHRVRRNRNHAVFLIERHGSFAAERNKECIGERLAYAVLCFHDVLRFAEVKQSFAAGRKHVDVGKRRQNRFLIYAKTCHRSEVDLHVDDGVQPFFFCALQPFNRRAAGQQIGKINLRLIEQTVVDAARFHR
ncbi:hypothetical protein SDC9_58378 [bioreactor metagenome]|uniref:Uncharacterized protein n=1 Tax=bioreactor metagenome TaxID=1076179 RepID=A0A644X7W7_9ZZZZ